MFSIDVNTFKGERFAVPPLKPLGLNPGNPQPVSGVSVKSPTTLLDDAESTGSEAGSSDDGLSDIWTTKPDQSVARNLTFSWDAPVRGPATRGAFLSEQPARVFVASRYHVQPRLESDTIVARRFISPSDLLISLRTTLLGATSLLFGWDDDRARFFVRSENNKLNDAGGTVLVLGELSEETTASLVEPFLNIGALLRRIEMTIAELRNPSTIPTARALAFSLQSIIALIQRGLTDRLPPSLTMASLTRLSTVFNNLKAELEALAEFCLCPLDDSPPFALLPTTQAELLDHLFLALDHAFSHSAPYRIPAMLAYLLVTSSQSFNDALAITIGLTPPSSRPVKSLVLDNKKVLPSFFSPQSRSVLESAARALDILQRADPGHPLCEKDSWTWEGPGWGWTDKELQAIDTHTQRHVDDIKQVLDDWYDSGRIGSGTESAHDAASAQEETDDRLSDLVLPEPDPVPVAASSTRIYKPELVAFGVFDQPPGSHIAKSTKDDVSVAQIISKGPTTLPLSSPTLPLLVDSTVLALPLAHSRLISSALLRLFVNRLALKTHLKVVRGFLLGGDPAFWSRLRGALFEESGISNVSAAVGRGIRAGVRTRLGIVDPTRDHIADERAEREGRPREWGVGLSLGLSERGGAGTWPPGGAELGLRLRHVIDDALEVGWGTAPTTESDDGESENVERDREWVVLKETSWRLGFILRDLEEESTEGRARWLNPNAIEALDFLCLDYKPPDPIDVILTLDVRHKMHRIFTFLLRLLRVETVTRMLFNTVFQYTSDNPPILLIARFKIQSFVSTLIGYVTDIAIGSNWDAFMTTLGAIERANEENDVSVPRRDPNEDKLISDIFTVHSHLSAAMDRMLEACLLRTRQRGIGNVLKECMEAVLVLGKLVGDRCHQHTNPSTPEYEAKEKHFVLNVTKVVQRFDKLYNALINALRALDLKGATTPAIGIVSPEDIQLLRKREGNSESAYGRMATWLDPTGRCVKSKPNP